MKKPQLYIIRRTDGHPVAIHERRDEDDGRKSFAWWTIGVDGQPTKVPEKRRPGFKVADLPLFGTQWAMKWDASRPVIICEGEKDALALMRLDYRCLGTVGGSTPPGPGPLAILVGLEVVLWPDADDSGRQLMDKIAIQIYHAVRSLRMVEWAAAPPGGGAADAVAAGEDIDFLIASAVPVPEPPKMVIPIARSRSPVFRGDSQIDRFNDAVTVTDVLRRDFGIEARPGRSVRCPFHDDRNPSLSILKDDRRAYCHAGCWANNDGRGRDAWDLAHAAVRKVAR